jgi:hypothetical protein
VRIMDRAVEDGIGGRRVARGDVPFGARELARATERSGPLSVAARSEGTPRTCGTSGWLRQPHTSVALGISIGCYRIVAAIGGRGC